MHDRLSEILDEEVVGEVESAVFDVALGRVCLELLSPYRIEKLISRLRGAFPPERLRVVDLLHAEDPTQLVRGMVLVVIQQPLGTYLLQLTARPLVSYYERRFFLEPGVLGDLMGTLCTGLAPLLAAGEQRPLRLLSRFDALLEQHRQHLDEVLRAALNGYDFVDAAPRVESLVEPLRQVWRLTPWPLREQIAPLSRLPADRLAPHDPVPRRTVLVAEDLLEGRRLHQTLHAHSPREEYDQVLAWMVALRGSLRERFCAPHHAVALARAPSVERFVECFPGFRQIVGTPLEEAA